MKRRVRRRTEIFSNIQHFNVSISSFLVPYSGFYTFLGVMETHLMTAWSLKPWYITRLWTSSLVTLCQALTAALLSSCLFSGLSAFTFVMCWGTEHCLRVQIFMDLSAHNTPQNQNKHIKKHKDTGSGKILYVCDDIVLCLFLLRCVCVQVMLLTRSDLS